MIPSEQMSKHYEPERTQKCWECDGKGVIYGKLNGPAHGFYSLCDTCNGHGYIAPPQEVTS